MNVLDPGQLVDGLVAELQTMTDEVTAMGGTGNISAYHFIPGVNVTLSQAIVQMPSPSLLVAHAGISGGNFDGETIFKHHIQIWVRLASQAGVGSPTTYERIWYYIMNDTVNSGPGNIWNTDLIVETGSAAMVDLPSYDIMSEEHGQGMEFWCLKTVWNELF